MNEVLVRVGKAHEAESVIELKSAEKVAELQRRAA
jgi:hypothetical protein